MPAVAQRVRGVSLWGWDSGFGIQGLGFGLRCSVVQSVEELYS